jgi:hypothetical protein
MADWSACAAKKVFIGKRNEICQNAISTQKSTSDPRFPLIFHQPSASEMSQELTLESLTNLIN